MYLQQLPPHFISMFKFEEKPDQIAIRQLVTQIHNYYVESDSVGVLAVLFKRNSQDFPWKIPNYQFFRLTDQNILANSCIACSLKADISQFLNQESYVLRLPISMSQSQGLKINRIVKTEVKQVEIKPDVKELQSKVQYNKIIANVDVSPNPIVKNITVQNQKLPKDVEEIQNNLIYNKIQFEDDQNQNIDNDQKEAQMQQEMEQLKQKQEEERQAEQLRLQKEQEEQQIKENELKEKERIRLENEQKLQQQLRLQQDQKQKQDLFDMERKKKELDDKRKQEQLRIQELLEEQKRQQEEQNKKARSNIPPLIATMAKYIQTWNNNIQLYFCEDKTGFFKTTMQQLGEAMQVQINFVSTYDNNNTQTFCVFVFFNQSSIPDPVQKIIQQKLECEKHIVVVLQQANILVLFHLQYNNELVESKVIQGSLNASQYVTKLKDQYKKFIVPTPKIDLTPIKNQLQQALTQISCINSLKVLATNQAKQQVVNVAKKDALAQLTKEALQKAKQDAIKQKQQKENEMVQEKQIVQKDAEQKRKLQKIQQIKKALDQTIQQSPISCLQQHVESIQNAIFQQVAQEEIDNELKTNAGNEAQQEALKQFEIYKQQQKKPQPKPTPGVKPSSFDMPVLQSQLPKDIQQLQQLLMNNQIDFEKPIDNINVPPHDVDGPITTEKQQFEAARKNFEQFLTDEYKILKQKQNKTKDQSYEFLMKALELFSNNPAAENPFNEVNFKYLENGYNDFQALCSALQQLQGDHDKNRCTQLRQLIEQNCDIIKQMVEVTPQPGPLIIDPQPMQQEIPQEIEQVIQQLKSNQIQFIIETIPIDPPKPPPRPNQNILASEEKLKVVSAYKQARRLLNKTENCNERIQKLVESSDVFNDVSKLPDMSLNEVLQLLNKFTTNSFKDQFEQNLNKDENLKQEKDNLMMVVGQIMDAGEK